MVIRLSLASMLTVLAVLAAPAVSLHAQAPGRSSPAKAGGPQADTSAKDESPEIAAQPTTAEATLASKKSDEPSQERLAVLERTTQVRQAKAARRLANLRWRQAVYAQQRRQAQWNQALMVILGGTTEFSASSSSCSSSSGCSSSDSSQDSARQSDTPIYPAPAPVQSRSLTGEILDAHRQMSQRYP